MQSVTGKGLTPRDKLVPTADQRSAPREKKVAQFCEYVEPATPADLGTSFRVFEDINGSCWKCFRPMTCDHAIVIFGKLHSCRLRTAAIYQEMRS